LESLLVSLPEFHSSPLGLGSRREKDRSLSRHEGGLRPGQQLPLSLEELIALIGESGIDGDVKRQEAIACYLSGGDGWKQAVEKLDGAFAPPGAALRDRKPG
jgi:hypothetical protein